MGKYGDVMSVLASLRMRGAGVPTGFTYAGTAVMLIVKEEALQRKGKCRMLRKSD
jgi:hypothetical protein